MLHTWGEPAFICASKCRPGSCDRNSGFKSMDVAWWRCRMDDIVAGNRSLRCVFGLVRLVEFWELSVASAVDAVPAGTSSPIQIGLDTRYRLSGHVALASFQGLLSLVASRTESCIPPIVPSGTDSPTNFNKQHEAMNIVARQFLKTGRPATQSGTMQPWLPTSATESRMPSTV
jgi:hypothetical protein